MIGVNFLPEGNGKFHLSPQRLIPRVYLVTLRPVSFGDLKKKNVYLVL